MKKDKTNWNVPVPRILDDSLEEAVRQGTYSTKSDFIRDVVRRKLEELGFRTEVFKEKEKNALSH